MSNFHVKEDIAFYEYSILCIVTYSYIFLIKYLSERLKYISRHNCTYERLKKRKDVSIPASKRTHLFVTRFACKSTSL